MILYAKWYYTHIIIYVGIHFSYTVIILYYVHDITMYPLKVATQNTTNTANQCIYIFGYVNVFSSTLIILVTMHLKITYK